MGSYSLLEEVWDKPLVENQDLLVNQRVQHVNSSIPRQPLQAFSPGQTYPDISQQYAPSVDHTIPQSRAAFSPPQSLPTATPASRSQGKPMHLENNSSYNPTTYPDDSRYVDRIRALEEQIARLERSINTKPSSIVGEIMSNNDLLMYIATGAFFIFVMDNIAKMSKGQ